MRKWIFIGILLGVLIIAFGIFVLRISESTVPHEAEPQETGSAITDIHFTDTYRKGIHTIKGTATVPTACVEFSADITAPSGTSTPIRVDLSAPADSGICLELATSVSFNLSVTAPAEAPIAIYTNGMLATSTESE